MRGAALQRLLEHLVRLGGADLHDRAQRFALHLRIRIVEHLRADRAAPRRPPRPRSRSIAARRTAGLRELFSSLAYSRAAGPNDTRMSRRRRTMRALSSPISASDIGLTSDGPIVVHILLAIANSASVAFCSEHRQVPNHRAFDELR